MTKHDPARTDRVLAVIEEFTRDHGYAPSIQEIGSRVGLASKAAVWHHLRKLEQEGRIVREAGVSRAIRLSHSSADDAVYAVMMDRNVGELSPATQDLLVAAFRPRVRT